MKDPSYAMQGAVHAALVNSAAVKALVGDPARIFDKVESDPVYPFVRIGDDQALGRSNACADGWEFFATVHIFSRDVSAPRPEVKLISNAIGLAIGDDDAPPAPVGFRIDVVELERSETYMEDDGLTAHGVMTFRYLVMEA